MNENWLPVVGYEGLYEVSDLGRVRSLPRRVVMPEGSIFGEKTIKGMLLKQCNNSRGYKIVTLCRDGVKKTAPIHKLVMLCFVGPNPSGLMVLHRDGNPINTILRNLRYGTHQDNMDDKVRHGRQARHFGETNPQSKLTHIQVSVIKQSNEHISILAKAYGVNKATIYDIQHGRTWTHV